MTLPITAAFTLLIVGYLALLIALIRGEEESINGFSFVIWGSLSLCLNFLSREVSVDKLIQMFTAAMCVFQYIIAVVCFYKHQYKKVSRYEIAAVVIAICSMTLWYVLQEKMVLVPILLLIVADTCAVIPSILDIRKAGKIENGSIFGFILFGVVASLVMFGLETKNPQSLAYPVFEVCVNFGIAIFSYYKKQTLQVLSV